MQRFYSVLARTLWYALVFGVITLAAYSAGMRALLAELHRVDHRLIEFLSEVTDSEVSLKGLSGGLRGFSPHFKLQQLSITPLGQDATPLTLDQVDIAFDLWASLLARDLRFSRLQLNGLELTLDLSRSMSSARSVPPFALLSLLQEAETVWVSDTRIAIELGAQRRIDFQGSAKLLRAGSERQLRLRLRGSEGSHLSLAGSGIGDILDAERFQGEFHGRFSSPDMQPLLTLFGVDGGGAGDLGFWYHVGSDGPSLTTSIAARDLVLSVKPEQQLRFDRVQASALIKQGVNGWSIRVQDFNLTAENNQFELARAAMDIRGGAIRLRTTPFDVSPLAAVTRNSGLLPDAANKVVAALAPAGRIEGLELAVADYHTPLEDWSISAQGVDLTTNPFEGVPGLGGIDASFEADHTGATAWIDTKDFSLDITRAYRQPLLFPSVRGHLSARWTSNLLTLEQGVLKVAGDDHDAMVQFAMDIPLRRSVEQNTELAMYLSVGFGRAPLSIRHRYLPSSMSQALSGWLETSIHAGGATEGAFLWRGGFKDYGHGQQSLQLGLNVQQLELAFSPQWPALDIPEATILVDTNRVSAWSTQAGIAELNLQALSVEVDANASVNRLLAISEIDTDASHIITTLRQSPVYERAYAVLSDITAQGDVTGTLTVALDLGDKELLPSVQIDSQLDNVTLGSERLQLTLQQMNGPLVYNTMQGFQAPSIEGLILDQPFDITIGQSVSGFNDAGVLDARLNTALSSESFTDWLQLVTGQLIDETVLPLEGGCGVTLTVGVGDTTSLRVNTDLQGLAVNLPSPLGKARATATPLSASLSLGQGSALEVFWQERLNGIAQGENGFLEQARIDFTPSMTASTLATLGAGLHLTGRVPHVDLQSWIDTSLVTALSSKVLSDDGLPPAVFVDGLLIDQLSVGSRRFGNTEVNAERFESWDGWRLTTSWLDASLTLPFDGDPTLVINDIDFDQLPVVVGEEISSDLSPPRLNRPLTVFVANMRLGDEMLGALRFDVSGDGQSLRVTELSGNVIDIDLLEGTQLAWQLVGERETQTTLVLNAELDNVSRTFEILGLEPVSETDSGHIASVLRWQGSPIDIDTLKLVGDMDLTLREGSFLPVPSGATGAVRLFSLLNLAGLFERANVTRLFEPGVAFKKAEGTLFFNAGQLAVPGFSVEGPGGGFKFTSDIDLITRSLDGELVVTLPLANNIPWVVALAGGLPVAAGAYIASRVFKDQVKTLTSGVYSVTGSVDEPTVKFVRVFDATGTKQTQGSVTDTNAAATDRGESSEPASLADEPASQ